MLDISSLPDKAPQYDLRTLFTAGMHYGHHRSKWHPRMAQFIHSEKEGVHLIDLAKTADQLRIAYNLLYQLGVEKKPVILVGTKRQAREIVKSIAPSSGLLYITSRWLGGLLTNWNQVKRSIQHMIDTETKLAEGAFQSRTKYEIVQIEKEVARARRFFDGIRSLTDLPAAVVVVDASKEHIAISEARRVGVPVIALVDTNTNPDEVDVAVPANDDAVKSIEYFVAQVCEAYQAGMAGKTAPAKTSEEKPEEATRKETAVVKREVAEKKTAVSAKKTAPKKETAKKKADVVEPKPKAAKKTASTRTKKPAAKTKAGTTKKE